MPLPVIPYDREKAVAYAHQWAFRRNPAYFDYEEIGGDCTNFASQCLYAGTGIMNFTPTFGWYYINANNKAPAWTGVPYFRNFLLRPEPSQGPFGFEGTLADMEIADYRPLSTYTFQEIRFLHILGAYPPPGNNSRRDALV